MHYCPLQPCLALSFLILSYPLLLYRNPIYPTLSCLVPVFLSCYKGLGAIMSYLLNALQPSPTLSNSIRSYIVLSIHIHSPPLLHCYPALGSWGDNELSPECTTALSFLYPYPNPIVTLLNPILSSLFFRVLGRQ